MPPYTQIGPVSQLLSKCIGYSWGKPPVAPCRVQIVSIAIATDVGTVVGLLKEGFGPVVGDLAYVQGVGLQSGALNNQVGEITSVVGPDASGNITIEFALTGSDVGTTASVGVLTTIPEPQQEAVTDGGGGPGQAWAVSQNGYGLSWDFGFTGSTSVTAQLEGSISNDPNSFIPIGDAVTSTSSESAGAIAQAPADVNFVRINLTSVSGDGTVYARILAS